MLQQIIALIIIAFVIFRLFWQKKKGLVAGSEFKFWLVFWFLSALAMIFIRKIDALVAGMGFSGSGIEILIYFSVFFLFYLIFRLRLRILKIEREITKIVREVALKENEK